MVDIMGTNIPIEAPKFSLAMNTWTIVLIFIILFVLVMGGVGIWAIMHFKTFSKKIVVFENISGRGYQPVFKDRARPVKIGNSGEELLFLKKKKVYRSAYGKKMGKNTYWFAVGQDGYWYNFVLGDVDAKLGMLDIEPTNTSARFEYTAMAQNIERNYTKKPSVMDKYGAYVISGLFLIIMLIGIFILLGRIGEIASNNAAAVESSRLAMETAKSVISSLDNICSRGGGMIPAG